MLAASLQYGYAVIRDQLSVTQTIFKMNASFLFSLLESGCMRVRAHVCISKVSVYPSLESIYFSDYDGISGVTTIHLML